MISYESSRFGLVVEVSDGVVEHVEKVLDAEQFVGHSLALEPLVVVEARRVGRVVAGLQQVVHQGGRVHRVTCVVCSTVEYM